MLLTLLLALAHGGVAVEDVLTSELARAQAAWQEDEEPPYYVAVAVEDARQLTLSARDGALYARNEERARFLDVDLRLGSPELDSTHGLRGFSAIDDDSRERLRVAMRGPGEEPALRHALWRELDDRYRDARERIVLLRAERQVRVAEEHPAPDFEMREPVQAEVPVPPLVVDAEAWSEQLVALSEILDDSEVVVQSEVRLTAVHLARTWVDTDGGRVLHGRVHARVGMQLGGVADDGDEVSVFEAIDVADPSSLPDARALASLARQARDELEALVAAPRVGPYQGPVLLSGKATGVFFHEVMGHRVEGHRQKLDYEGKTFLEFVGRPVLPDFIDVYDDPTLARLHATDLNGHYAFDDEGVPAARAELVEQGVFVGFLMGRSPIMGFEHSNGHGRRSAGNPPSSRMGNTIVETDTPRSAAQLRRQLLAEARQQGLDYAYIVEEIDGGFTLTGRVIPNAFNVRASRTRRVWVDGRPDELVRGIDLVGTPLVAFQSIVAAGDTPEIFNGTCGAESGWVPVSAVAPPMLFRRLEFQLKEKSSERPPLLPKPTEPDGQAVLP